MAIKIHLLPQAEKLAPNNPIEDIQACVQTVISSDSVLVVVLRRLWRYKVCDYWSGSFRPYGKSTRSLYAS